jgi:D-glycero-D-manno-heptose 1,7-bisphosphate phosphatase
MPTSSKRNRAVILDRDGTLNHQVDGEYILSPKDLKILPGVSERIKAINKAGWLTLIVTNQQCVGKGLCTNEVIGEVNDSLTKQLAISGARIDAYMWCPHLKEDECYCRKPRPGMFYYLASRYHLDLRECLFIGDSESDMLAARAANIQWFPVTKNKGIQQWNPESLAKVREMKVLPCTK